MFALQLVPSSACWPSQMRPQVDSCDFSLTVCRAPDSARGLALGMQRIVVPVCPQGLYQRAVEAECARETELVTAPAPCCAQNEGSLSPSAFRGVIASRGGQEKQGVGLELDFEG